MSANGRHAICQWPSSIYRRASSASDLVPVAIRFAGAPCGARFALHRMGRQRKESAVGKFKIPAKHLDLTLPAAFSFDDEFGADRKTARQPA